MFGFGDKNKVHKVTIANTGETFEVTGKINLLAVFKVLFLIVSPFCYLHYFKINSFRFHLF